MMEETQNNPCQPPSKITPLQLREQYGLNIADLAWKANVAPGTVYFMMVGRPISREQAEQILATISVLTGQRYTLDNVCVPLLPEEKGQAGPMDGSAISDIGEDADGNR